MSTDTTAETPKATQPYDPEPEHVVAARDALKAANKLLNEKLAALGHFQSVFGSESQEAERAMAQVHAAQAAANVAAIDKDIVLRRHGIEVLQAKFDAAQAALRDAAKKSDVEAIATHASALGHIKKALHDPVHGMVAHHDARMRRYADTSMHEHVSDATKQALKSHGLSR